MALLARLRKATRRRQSSPRVARNPEELREQIIQARSLQDRAKAASYRAKEIVCHSPTRSIGLGVVIGFVFGFLGPYLHRR
jgi:ElaB/YqjD/DUF883 family membrane-anchored ribosome-binding protein